MKRTLSISAALVVGVLATLTIVGLLDRAEPRRPAGAGGTLALVGDIPIRYVQTGQGPDVLLLHGSPGVAEDWTPLLARLTDRFRVTAFDRPGHGGSGGADTPHSPEANARVALDLIHTLHLHDVVLVGHSYGGVTALALALQNPAEVRAFVLVAPRAYRPVDVSPLYRLLAVPGLGRGLSTVLGPWIGPGRVASGVRASFGPNVDLIPPDFIASRTAIWTASVTTTLAQEHTGLAGAFDAMAPHYAEIRKAVVIVVGENDPRPYGDSRRLARDIPGARLVTFPNTGHYVQYAHPDELARIVAEAAAP